MVRPVCGHRPSFHALFLLAIQDHIETPAYSFRPQSPWVEAVPVYFGQPPTAAGIPQTPVPDCGLGPVIPVFYVGCGKSRGPSRMVFLIRLGTSKSGANAERPALWLCPLYAAT